MTEAIIKKSETTDDSGYEAYLDSLEPTLDNNIFHPQILDIENYHEVIAKPSVVMIGDTPSLLGIEDAYDFVDEQRCLKIAEGLGQPDSKNIYVSVISAEALIRRMPEAVSKISNADSETIIFTELDIFDDRTQQRFEDELSPLGIKLHTLEHPKLHSMAALNLFELNLVVQTDELDHRRGVSEVISSEGLPNLLKTEGGQIVVNRGDMLNENELSQLWQLFSTRFADISDNLPVRLEETEATTRRLMADPRYNFIYKSDNDGNITASLFFTDDITAYPWINPNFISEREVGLEEQTSKESYSIFIPGIAADRRNAGSSAASQILERLTEALAQTNQPSISVRFECTDVSSRYVPLISMRAARNQQQFKGSSISQIGQKKFIALKLPARTSPLSA